MKKSLLVSVLFVMLTPMIYAQQTKSLSAGIKLITEFEYYNRTAPGIGAQVVYQMKKHSGLETGLYYSAPVIDFTVFYGNNFYQGTIAERRLYLPILYRYDARLLNFTIGPAIDYFLGWQTKSASQGVTVNSYTRPAVRVNGLFGLSKSIHLSSSVILEPEIRINFLGISEAVVPGLNVGLRKEIF